MACLSMLAVFSLCCVHLAVGSTVPSVRHESPDAVMPNLLFPRWAPTYNLTQSTMTQLCFGPGMGGTPVLNNQTGGFLKQWGIIALDFESQENTWTSHSPKDADVMMIEQAAVIKKMAPQSQVWVYRNLVQPYANFVQLREKLEDPQYAGWFVHFNDHSMNETNTPRCELNPRLNKTLCSDLFHTKLAWTERGHDCGDVIPCGDYVFDHRNQSLRQWIIDEYMMGPMGMGNRSAVDGFLLDDRWDLSTGPSEVFFFAEGSGMQPNSTEYREIYTNWSLTTTKALKAVRDAGGFTWSNVNCMLDPLYGKQDLGDKDGVCSCGLTKTNGSPRANNVQTAPIWDGRAGNDQAKGETGRKECAEWLREACSPSSVFNQIPTMLSFTGASTPRRPHPAPFFPALLQDIARFMLVRGAFSWMGYGWEGCITTAPPVVEFDQDYGIPVGRCAETPKGSGVFEREWSKAHVRMDCNSFEANITLTSSDAQ